MALGTQLSGNDEERNNAELYGALIREDAARVIELCKKIEDGPLHRLTVHKDTVLHLAAYTRQSDLVIQLLDMVPAPDHCDLNLITNDVGNTILHEIATISSAVDAATKMLDKAPSLLGARNIVGETALFRAVRYGKNEVFEFLAARVEEENKENPENIKNYLRRNDKTTILHMAILAEKFDLALSIAMKYEHLIGLPDEDDMTGLQLLACNASAFRSSEQEGFFKQFIYSRVSIDDPNMNKKKEPEMKFRNHFSNSWKFVISCWRLPVVEAIRIEKRRHDSASRLAELLVEKDLSWRRTHTLVDWSKPRIHKYGKGNSSRAPTIRREGSVEAESLTYNSPVYGEESGEGPFTISPSHAGDEEESPERSSITDSGETALFLATKNGCVEIVHEILTRYPQALEHINSKGRNILHVAIRHRQLNILDLLETMETRMKRLIRKIDYRGNSILHQAGIKKKEHAEEKIRSPVIQLQKELLLFERVQQASTAHFIKHYNNCKKTAEELFIANNMELRKEAREWLKQTSENCIIVAVLMSTVAFAAAYTIPGGPNQSTGLPVLLYQPFFVVFTITDVLSLTFSLTSVIIFLSILTSPYRLQDFKENLPHKLVSGFTFLIMSVSIMMVAFAATIMLMIHNKERWTKIVLYSVAFLPVSIFILSYLPLYLSLMKTFVYTFKKIGRVCPELNRRLLCFGKWHGKGFSKRRLQSDSVNHTATSGTSQPPV